MSEIKHPVKNPSRIRSIIGMSVILFSQSNLLLRTWDERVVSYVSLAVVLLCLVVLLLVVYRTIYMKPTELCLSDKQIILNGHIIHSKDIKVIMTRGYFKPTIGILPYRKKIVPLDMVFSYSKDEDSGISDLKNWAETNNVKMVNKFFQTWL